MPRCSGAGGGSCTRASPKHWSSSSPRWPIASPKWSPGISPRPGLPRRRSAIGARRVSLRPPAEPLRRRSKPIKRLCRFCWPCPPHLTVTPSSCRSRALWPTCWASRAVTPRRRQSRRRPGRARFPRKAAISRSNFPRPLVVGGCVQRWRLSDRTATCATRSWELAQVDRSEVSAGPRPHGPDDILVSGSATCSRPRSISNAASIFSNVASIPQNSRVGDPRPMETPPISSGPWAIKASLRLTNRSYAAEHCARER